MCSSAIVGVSPRYFILVFFQSGLQGPIPVYVSMYVSPHSDGTLYTTPLTCSIRGLPFSLVRRLLSVCWLRILSWSQFIDTSVEPVHSLLSRMEGRVFLIVLVDGVCHVPSCVLSSWVHTGLGFLGIHSGQRPLQGVWFHLSGMLHHTLFRMIL